MAVSQTSTWRATGLCAPQTGSHCRAFSGQFCGGDNLGLLRPRMRVAQSRRVKQRWRQRRRSLLRLACRRRERSRRGKCQAESKGKRNSHRAHSVSGGAFPGTEEGAPLQGCPPWAKQPRLTRGRGWWGASSCPFDRHCWPRRVVQRMPRFVGCWGWRGLKFMRILCLLHDFIYSSLFLDDESTIFLADRSDDFRLSAVRRPDCGVIRVCSCGASLVMIYTALFVSSFVWNELHHTVGSSFLVAVVLLRPSFPAPVFFL